MARTALCIADRDAAYIARLGDYMATSYSTKFDIHLFSEPQKLTEYIDSGLSEGSIIVVDERFCDELPEKASLILPEMLTVEYREKSHDNNYTLAGQPHAGATVLLLSGEKDEKGRIFKYMHADKIACEILYHHTKAAGKYGALKSKDRFDRTAITTFFSAAGGTGKTFISTGLSAAAARKGLKVLYLNLEDVPSTGLYFKSDNRRNFSELLFYLEAGGSRLAGGIEALSIKDGESGVFFIPPPDRSSEMKLLGNEKTSYLFKTLKNTGLFDLIVVDLQSGFSERVSAAIVQSDIAVEVVGVGSAASLKSQLAGYESGRLDTDSNLQMSNSFLRILNKYYKEYQCMEALAKEEARKEGNFDIVYETDYSLNANSNGSSSGMPGKNYAANLRLLELILNKTSKLKTDREAIAYA